MEEELLKKRIAELRKRAEFGGYAVFTDFLTLSEQDVAKFAIGNTPHRFFGGADDTERCMLGISEEEAFLNKEMFPISVLRIVPKNAKFAEELTHRDVLGSVLGLGLLREVIGDIFLKDSCVYLFCEEKIASFLTENLTQIKHTFVVCSVCEDMPDDLRPNFSETVRSVAALRLDSIAAAAFDISRSKVATDIAAGKLYVNGREILSASYIVKETDVLSYRGVGKARLKTIGNLTRKGRISVTLEHYQ